ncbi:MAG TPA: hypothetical protein VK899_00585, partial [Gemmatimonadales bacterium]|nr:hypothetical protein [Gemmatimonadales bacterium]
MLLKLLFLLPLMLAFAVTARGGDAPSTDSLQGTWLPVTAELSGTQFPDEVRKTIKLVVQDDRYTVTVGQTVDQGTTRLNPAAS